MKLEDIVKLEPQVGEIEYGTEPSLRSLIEMYYQPHFPDFYKNIADKYIEQLQVLVSQTVNDGEIKVGDLVKVAFDSKAGTPESFANDGINIGDVGVVDEIDKREDYPVNVRFNNGIEVAFLREELGEV